MREGMMKIITLIKASALIKRMHEIERAFYHTELHIAWVTAKHGGDKLLTNSFKKFELKVYIGMKLMEKHFIVLFVSKRDFMNSFK